MDKEVFGQPLWLWATGAVVVIGGYLYFRSHSAAPSTGQGSGQVGGQEKSSSSFKEWITQHQGPPGGPPPKDGPGPEREWLIHKTGSNRPWTFLRQHHERVEVGPTGSRKIVGA